MSDPQKRSGELMPDTSWMPESMAKKLIQRYRREMDIRRFSAGLVLVDRGGLDPEEVDWEFEGVANGDLSYRGEEDEDEERGGYYETWNPRPKMRSNLATYRDKDEGGKTPHYRTPSLKRGIESGGRKPLAGEMQNIDLTCSSSPKPYGGSDKEPRTQQKTRRPRESPLKCERVATPRSKVPPKKNITPGPSPVGERKSRNPEHAIVRGTGPKIPQRAQGDSPTERKAVASGLSRTMGSISTPSKLGPAPGAPKNGESRGSVLALPIKPSTAYGRCREGATEPTSCSPPTSRMRALSIYESTRARGLVTKKRFQEGTKGSKVPAVKEAAGYNAHPFGVQDFRPQAAKKRRMSSNNSPDFGAPQTLPLPPGNPGRSANPSHLYRMESITDDEIRAVVRASPHGVNGESILSSFRDRIWANEELNDAMADKLIDSLGRLTKVVANHSRQWPEQVFGLLDDE